MYILTGLSMRKATWNIVEEFLNIVIEYQPMRTLTVIFVLKKLKSPGAKMMAPTMTSL